MLKASRSVRILILIALLSCLAYASFNRPWYRPSKPEVTVPSPLTPWLEQSESKFPLRPGVQKEVTWILGAEKPTEWAFAYLHGFSASRKEISPTLEKASALLQTNVFWSRLRAHGMSGAEFRDLTADRFFEDGEEAYQILKQIGRHRVLVGASTGATLALAEAVWHPDLDGMILISPNFDVAQTGAWLLGGPLGPFMGHLVLGGERSWTARSPEQEHFWTTRYRTEGLTAMTDMVNAVKRMPLEKMQVPCLVLMTKADRVIDLISAEKTLARIPKGICEIHWIEAENHVLSGDILSPSSTETVIAEITTFVRKLAEKKQAKDL